jgi:hypothetical protein
VRIEKIDSFFPLTRLNHTHNDYWMFCHVNSIFNKVDL